MKESPHTVYHEGIVDHLENRKLFVRILAKSACGSCHAKSICSSLDMQEKIIEVKSMDESGFKPGDPVILEMTESMGIKATLLGYLVPFALLLATLITGSIFLSELASGLLAIAILLPYFLLLRLFRKKINQTFHFRIKQKPDDFTFSCNP